MPWKTCSRNHRFFKTSDCPSCPICWKGAMKTRPETDLPSIGAPATRALNELNITSLQKLSTYTQKEIANLHGVGPKAVGILRKALQSKRLTFKKS